ncbi:MAG: hypothetical protein ACLU9S_24775 [Oscillospiraceae bacterium]
MRMVDRKKIGLLGGALRGLCGEIDGQRTETVWQWESVLDAVRRLEAWITQELSRRPLGKDARIAGETLLPSTSRSRVGSRESLTSVRRANGSVGRADIDPCSAMPIPGEAGLHPDGAWSSCLFPAIRASSIRTPWP